jgi:hypothetical protein
LPGIGQKSLQEGADGYTSSCKEEEGNRGSKAVFLEVIIEPDSNRLPEIWGQVSEGVPGSLVFEGCQNTALLRICKINIIILFDKTYGVLSEKRYLKVNG